jgi:hypothetical protein
MTDIHMDVHCSKPSVTIPSALRDHSPPLALACNPYEIGLWFTLALCWCHPVFFSVARITQHRTTAGPLYVQQPGWITLITSALTTTSLEIPSLKKKSHLKNTKASQEPPPLSSLTLSYHLLLLSSYTFPHLVILFIYFLLFFLFYLF